MAYQRPMVTVDQNMTITPTSIERQQPAFIFGPNYVLHRYSDPDEKDTVKVSKKYDGNGMVFKYPGVMNPGAVDKDYTKLFGDSVVAELDDMGSAKLPEYGVPATQRAINGGYTKLLFEGKNYVDQYPSGSSSPGYDGIEIKPKIGDLLWITYTESGFPTSILTKIKDVKDAIQYSNVGFNLDGSSSPELEGSAGTLITISDAIPETVSATASTTVSVKLVAVLDNVEFSRKDEVDENNKWQWEQKEIVDPDGDGESKVDGIEVINLYAYVGGYFSEPKYCDVLAADLYVTSRELDTSYSDTFHSVTGASEVASQLGTVDPDNPLAMGVYMAALNSVTDDGDEAPPVYYMAIPKPGIEGYQAVLNKATVTDRAYVFAPTTRDKDVLEAVRTHCIDMSTKVEKMWRIASASSEIPRTVNRLDHLLDPQGDEFLAIPIAEDGSMAVNRTGGKFNTLRVVRGKTNTAGNQDTQFQSNLVVGDMVRFGYHEDKWGDEVSDEYVITEIVNNYTVKVDTKDGYIDVECLGGDAGAANFTPSKIEIYHTYTAKESADEIAKISKGWASRRMLNVFPSEFSYNGVAMTGEFAACAVAGLISATEPQQPITNVTVRGIDNIPMTYQTYNKYELDTIAAGGTFIIAQDLPNDIVYVRHQITTAYPDGNLNTAELSITKNVDSISYAFAEVFRPYYGKYNITPELVAILENLAGALISQLGGSTSVYGPQLIMENTKIRYVRQNELMKDHVDVAITLGVPYPCNVIDIILTV